MLQKLLTSTPILAHPNKRVKVQKLFDENVRSHKRETWIEFYVNYVPVVIIFVLIIAAVCHISFDVFQKCLKVATVGAMAIGFSWEVVYFDSTMPGVTPPSPLSPRKIREMPNYTIHTSYLFSIIYALLFAVMMCWWL